MSKREDIASHIVTTIEAISSPSINKVTRQPFNLEELAQSQYPAVLVASNNLASAIETALETDITRNNKALDTEVISLETDAGTLFPYGAISMVVKVVYEHESATP